MVYFNIVQYQNTVPTIDVKYSPHLELYQGSVILDSPPKALDCSAMFHKLKVIVSFNLYHIILKKQTGLRNILDKA